MHPTKTTPKDVFLHILGIITLIIGVVSLIALMFSIITIRFHDTLDAYYRALDAFNKARGAIAALIVVWPAHILISWILGKDIAAFPEKRELGVRRWLTHLTLFIAALTIIIDLITVIHNFLNGELTITFFLKTVAVFAVAGAVFGYYFWDIRGASASSRFPRAVAIAVSLALLASIATGIFYVGSPNKERARRFDGERVNGLQTIQQEVFNYWTQTGKLPESLHNLANNFTGFVPMPNDPETGASYEYIVNRDHGFALCAVFVTESFDKSSGAPSPFKTYPSSGLYDGEYNWVHGAGRVCFNRDINPEFYKPKIDDGVSVPSPAQTR